MASLLQMLAASMDTANSIDDTPVMDEKGADVVPASSEIVFDNVDFLQGEWLRSRQRRWSGPRRPKNSGSCQLYDPCRNDHCHCRPVRFWQDDYVQLNCPILGCRRREDYGWRQRCVDFNLDSLMKNISMVFQNVYLFADLIENNIKFGCPDATHEQVAEAAKKACCHEFISALTDGYDTVIGEGGRTLSGGEKQRISIARAMDQIGPVGKDVADCAALLEIIAGHDEKDSTSMKREDLQFSKELTGDVKGMKFGVPEEYLAEGLDPEVKASFMGVLDTLKEMGAEVEFFSIKTMEYMIPAYYIIASAEASSNLERFDGVKYGYRAAEYDGLHDMYKKTRTEAFGEEVKRRIMLGSFVLSSGYYDAYYLKALRTKALIKKEFNEAFSKYDVLLAPASPFTAPKIGESLKDPLAMYLGDIYTVAVNLCGLPGVTVPCGKDSKGLPIGIQMIGDCFMEKKILRAAHAYEISRGSFAVPGEGGIR